MFLFCLTGTASHADDSSDAAFGQIKKLDLSDERPPAPTHAVVTMNLSKLKPGHLAQVTLYQFSKRARIDFDGDLPTGEYSLSVATSCDHTKGATLLHRFKSVGTHVQTEKSLPNVSLSEAKPGMLVLMGKGLVLSRGVVRVDCQPIKP